MERRREKEEYLETLWVLLEQGSASREDLRAEVGGDYREDIVEELVREGVLRSEDGAFSFTEAGHLLARQVIRAHRLAERLVHDVLGVEYEKGACEFEHIISRDLVDSICTLLGHPRECPHGMAIPEGECCRSRARVVESTVEPLTELEVGREARIAYVHARDDRQLHRLDSLMIRPGVQIRLHQRRPTVVIECEGAMVALDDQVAAAVHVWAAALPSPAGAGRPGGRRGRRGFRHGAPGPG